MRNHDTQRTEMELLTSRQLGELLKIPVKHVYGLAIPGRVRLGRRARWRRAEVERWLAAGGDDASGPQR